MPYSEVWFHELFKKHQLPKCKMVVNDPFLWFIPDCISHTYKFVIEVQDSSHNLPERILSDRRKLIAMHQRGYKTFYVTAFSSESFLQFKADYLEYIKAY